MTDCLSAADAAIKRYCNRDFELTSYDELFDGSGYYNLLLNQYPVTLISRVMFNLVPACMIRNTNSLASSAMVRMDTTTLYLDVTASGVTTSHTLTLASYATINDLAAAISTFSADGWAATAQGIFGTYPVTDMRAPQGAWTPNGVRLT